MPTLRLHFFGKLDIQWGDNLLPKPATLKSQSLLAYLILHRHRPQTRDSLIGMFWADRPERKARGSLSTALWHIRRCLPNETFLLSDSQTVQFNPDIPIWLDVEIFESLISQSGTTNLEEASNLYRGDLLNGFYDDWIINERYRLETMFLDLLAHLMVIYETEEEDLTTLATALRLLSYDPLREDAHRACMRAYYRLGQRNMALEQYNRCRQSVREELGIEPMAETREVYQTILENRFTVEPTNETHRLSALPPAHPSLAAGHNPLDIAAPNRLVGRQRESKFLDSAWEEVLTNKGLLVLIDGEAGIGKTRLVEAFADRLRWKGTRVLWGCCYEFERLLPYQPIAEALGTTLLSMTSDELEDLPSWAVSEVVHLVPELLEKYPSMQVVPSIRSDHERTRLFEGIARIITRLSTHGPLLIVLDDLHWATASTLQLVHYLTRYLKGSPVMVVCTSRIGSLNSQTPLGKLQQQLEREGLARSLHLSHISKEDVETLITEMSGAGEAVVSLARRLYRETEGNPFFLIEIVKSLFETGKIYIEEGAWQGDFDGISKETIYLPGKLSTAVTERIHRLSDDAQKILYLAAVLGREFDYELLNDVSGMGEEATLEALDELLRQQLVSEQSGAIKRDYIFTHHIIREVAYRAIPRIRRQRMHAKVGEVMEGLYGSHTETIASELAFHFQQAQQPIKALIWLEKAGDHAKKQYAVEEAVSFYTQALEIVQKNQIDPARESDLLRCRAEAHLLDGAFDAARVDLEQSLAITRKIADRALQVQVLLALADCYFHQDDFTASVDAAREAAALAQEIGDERSAGIALRFEGQALYFPGHNIQEGRKKLEQACEKLEAVGDKLELGWAHLHLGALFQERTDDLDAALPHLQIAQRLFNATRCAHGEILISDLFGNQHLYKHELEKAVALYSHSLTTAREIGYAAEEPGELARLAIVHTLLGNLTTARKYAEGGLLLSQTQGTPGWEIYNFTWLGHIAYEERKPQEALHMLTEALHVCEGQIDYENYYYPWLKTQLSLIYRDLGGKENFNTALELTQQVCAGIDQQKLRASRIRALSQQAMAHLALGNQVQALACSKAAMELAEAHPLTFFALEIPFNHAQVLKANGEMSAYHHTLRKAHDLLMSEANKIQDSHLRKSFLENIRVHQAIIIEFKANHSF